MCSSRLVRHQSSQISLLKILALLGLASAAHCAPYAEWCRAELGTPAAAPLADEDGDGVPTLWEYYLGRHPALKDGPLPVDHGVIRTPSFNQLTASLPAPTAFTDAVVEWQVSNDLKSWTTVAKSISGGAFIGAGSNGVSGGRSLFSDPTPPTTGSPRFSRWIVTSPSAGAATLGAAPVVRILRDDRVATLEMDYNAEHPWGQFWTIPLDGRADAGFRVRWWPDGASGSSMASMGGCGGCAGACGHPTDPTVLVRQLITPNRRIQLQPLVNGGRYHVCIERLNALGEVTSEATSLDFDGGDGTRVDALRATLTYFDDFNLPEGPADEKLWNNAHSTQTDARFHQFFINAQFHAHTLNGTHTDTPDAHVGDKSQVAQRFRKPILIENNVRRRIVFDMDSPLSPRAVWYLDLNPVPTELTGHASFFDMDGEKALPAGIVRLRSQGQAFSVHLIGDDGATRKIASIDMEDLGVQAITNVRRAFDVRLGTDNIEVIIDGKSVINQSFAATPIRPGPYELLWSTIGYNSSKDNNPYFLVHWDNFGFDGPIVEPRTVHNYVTQIAGDDYQKAGGWDDDTPTFTIPIPDQLRPTSANTATEAWLVFVYQMGDYSYLNLLPTDHVVVNGTSYPLPLPINNSSPVDPDLLSAFDQPHTARIKLANLTTSSSAPLITGNNSIQFFAENAGISNVHVEIFYPPGSEPAYTPPASIHHFPMHAELPPLGPSARFETINGIEITAANAAIEDPTQFLAVSGTIPVAVIAGAEPWANWAPDLMIMPAVSAEHWSSGGTTGIKALELFLRPKGAGPETAQRIAILTTQRDAPSPLIRHAFEIDTRRWPNGDYELFVLATSTSGVKSHPIYDHSAFRWDATQWAGAYYPVNLKITN